MYLLAIHTDLKLVASDDGIFWLKSKRKRLPKWEFIEVSTDLSFDKTYYVNRKQIKFYTITEIK